MKHTTLPFLALIVLASACEPSEPHVNAHSFARFQRQSALPHALDPLSELELERGVSTLKSANLLGDGWYLQSMSTLEPTKTAPGTYPNVTATSRQARAVVLHSRQNERYECAIDLAEQRVISKTPIKGQPAVLDNEYDEVTAAMKGNADVKLAMGLRGITNMDDLFVDGWAPGDLADEGVDTTHRLLRAVFYLRQDATNPYSRPIEGITAIYDVTLGQVVKVEDLGVLPIPPHRQDFFKVAHDALPPPPGFSPDNSPIQVNGNEVAWGGWRFRYQMHPREGLVLYNVGRVDKGVFRTVLDRASLSEMVVPYSDPKKNWRWRAAFDQGDYGIGNNANSLLRGVHFPTDGLTFDAVIADNLGNIKKMPQVVAMYERSGGIAWSHYDSDSNRVAAQSTKELVVLFVFTVGNYDYGLQWIFKPDGSIQMQAVLTGIILTKGHQIQKCARCAAAANANANRLSQGDRFGTVVDKNIVGIAHQHFFNFRLDFAVDGGKNSVAEIDLSNLENRDENPHGNAFLLNERLLTTEKEAVRDVNQAEARHWWIFNPEKKNSLGHFSGYVLEPGMNANYFAQPHAHTYEAAPFLLHPFYVTKYDATEMHAAGDYPNQNEGDGIPKWIASRDTSILDEDVVVWYTVGVTHLPFAEDWPVMPAARAGFILKPMGFYEHNPTLELQD